MTFRERVTAVLAGEIPDAVPWCGDLTYWQHGMSGEGRLPEQFRGADGLREIHRAYRTGIYLHGPGLVRGERDPDLFRWESEPVNETDRRIVVTTPEGTLTGLERHCPVSHSTAILEYPVKTAADLRAVRAWYEGTRWCANYDAMLAEDRLRGDNGYSVPLTPRTPLATLAAQWSGVMNLAFIIADAPREFEDTIRAMRGAEDDLYRLTAAAPWPAVEIPDNLSAEAMGGLWRRYSRDYYRERLEELHASGKKVGCHIDGTLGRLLGDLVEVGIDFPESVVPAPVGDLALDEIRRAMGERAIVWGCVPGAMFAPPYTREQVLDWVREVFRVLAPGGRIVLATADQVPPNGDMDLARMIADLIEELGPPPA